MTVRLSLWHHGFHPWLGYMKGKDQGALRFPKANICLFLFASSP